MRYNTEVIKTAMFYSFFSYFKPCKVIWTAGPDPQLWKGRDGGLGGSNIAPSGRVWTPECTKLQQSIDCR